MLKRRVVDNTQIETFFARCQESVAKWNVARGEDGGEITATLDFVERDTDRKGVKLGANPPGVGGRPMTMLQIEYDADKAQLVAHTPGLPTYDRHPVSVERINFVLDNFNPAR